MAKMWHYLRIGLFTIYSTIQYVLIVFGAKYCLVSLRDISERWRYRVFHDSIWDDLILGLGLIFVLFPFSDKFPKIKGQ